MGLCGLHFHHSTHGNPGVPQGKCRVRPEESTYPQRQRERVNDSAGERVKPRVYYGKVWYGNCKLQIRGRCFARSVRLVTSTALYGDGDSGSGSDGQVVDVQPTNARSALWVGLLARLPIGAGDERRSTVLVVSCWPRSCNL